jgi:hypothetical protein
VNLVVAFACAWLTCCSVAPTPIAPTAPVLPLPPRVANCTGTALVNELTGMPLAEREGRILQHFEQGNVPSFLAALAPVTLRARIGERDHEAVVWCTPDYFGLGTDDDWLRLPITPQLAQHLAGRLDCVLPTRRVVDAIWTQATVKVEPRPFHPREHDILAVPVFAMSHAAIEAARGPAPRTALLAGHKKDVVISALLRDWPDRVVIYGWHHLDGKPIQPLWKGHTQGHVDYSHGIRFVARTMHLDGRPTTVDAVLADPVLHVLLSDEGPIAPARYSSPPARAAAIRPAAR